MRKGKMCAQAAHASFLAVADQFFIISNDNGLYDYYCIPMDYPIEQWLNGKFTKIVVGVNSEEELLDVYKQAKDLQLHCSLIKDAGLTEFKQPTYTAVGIGPDEPERIDIITGHLTLL